MNIKSSIRISIFLILLIVLVTFIELKIKKNSSPLNYNFNEKEKYIPRKNEEIKGIVKSFFANKGAIHITMSNNKKIIVYSSRNGEYKDLCYGGNLDEFLKINDSILKPSGSDSLFVFRNSKKYYFIIGKFINNK